MAGHGIWIAAALIGTSGAAIAALALRARRARRRPSRGLDSLLRTLLVGALAGLALVVATSQARASGTFNIGAATGFDVSSSTYANARDTINGAIATGLDLPLNIPDLQKMPVSSVSFNSDDAKLALTLQGDVTLQGQGASIQLSAVWDTASSTSPHLAIAVKPTQNSLQSLNALWASAPANPTLNSVLLVASPSSGYSFDPTKLPAASQSFYPHLQTLTAGPGLTLLADVDASSDANFSNALHFLGEGTSISIQGTLSGSVAPLFGGASQTQESGLDLTITITGSSNLPSWITSRTSTAELKVTHSGSSYTPSVAITDDMTTNLNGKVNEFAGSLTYDPSKFGGASVDVKYGLKSGTLQVPFGLDSLTLSNPQIDLAMDTSAKTFSGTLDVDATVSATTLHLTAGITVAGGGSVSASFGITGPITITDAANLANSLLGTSADVSALGTNLTINSITFSFSKDSSSQELSLDATATVRSLSAEVLLSLHHDTGSDPKLIVGLRLSDAGSSCNCITVSKLLGGTLSDLTTGLQLPAVDVFTSVGFGSGTVNVSSSSLTSAEQNFFKHIWSSLPATIGFGPKLTLAANLTLPDEVAHTFGMSTPAVVVLNGDLGFGLDAFSGSGAPSLGATISAQLPPISASLPGWISSTSTWTLSFGADTAGTVQLGVNGSIDAMVQGTDYPITVAGTVSKTGPNVDVTITGSLNGSITNIFGLSWLSVTNPSVSLKLHKGGTGTTYDAELDTDVTLGPSTAHVVASISKNDGTEASLTVSSTTALSTTDVASFFGIDLSGVSGLPTLTLNSLVAHAQATQSAKSLDMVADTTLTVGSHSFSSSLLLSLGKDTSANHVVVAIKPTSQVNLSDLVSSLPSGVDFSFPTLAVVLAHPSTTLTFANLLPEEQDFFNTFCGDLSSPCNTTLSLNDGLTFVAKVTIPSSLDGLLGAVHVDPSAAALVTGTLPIFGGGGFSLSVTLPKVTATSPSIPDMFQSSDLSLSISDTTLTLGGEMTFNIPKGSITDATKCTNLGGVLRLPRGVTTGTPTCYDQVPFDLSAALKVSPPSMTLTGGLAPTYTWQAPMDVEWLTLLTATAQFGVSFNPTPAFDLGFAIDASVANHDFGGAIKVQVLTTPNPPFIAINPEGFRIFSNSGISMQDLVDVGTAATGTNFSLGGVPNLAVRNLDLSWSEVDDPALCLPLGFHLAGQLYINPTSSAANQDKPVDKVCSTDSSHETNRSTACVNDASNGCFAAVDIGINAQGIHASGNLGAFTVGPLSFSGAQVDAELTTSVQRLLIKGGMTIPNFVSGNVDLLVSTSDMHFRGSVQVFGSAFDAFIDGESSPFNLQHLTDFSNPPAFSLKVVLRSDFLSQAGAALSGTLQQLKPAVQALDVVLNDISNNDILSAIIDVPAQVAKLGVSLPDPYGSALGDISSKLSDIKSDISVFGHAFNWGLNDLLNGFTLSFPGTPGLEVPATCVTTWQDGQCWTTPPGCVDLGLLGSICVPGIPGVVTPATCITTTVNGTCYSIPPITGVHIPGLCDALNQIPGLNLSCNSSSIIDDLLMPALRSAFKQVTGYDVGNLTLSTVLNDITNALGSGQSVSIDCAEFDAHVGASNGTPSAGVSLATDFNLFGNHYNYGISWNFSVSSGNEVQAITDVINSIIHPNTGATCALPSDWNSNNEFPDAVGTAPQNNSNVPAPPVTPTMSLSPAASPVDEGSAATVNGTVSPAPSSNETVTITWGDGTSSTTTVGTPGTFNASHTYGASGGSHEGQFAIHAAVSGGPSAGTMVTVRNVTPSNLVLTPSKSSINEGDSVTLGGSFTDPAPLDTHNVTITWGDGGSDTLSLAAGVTTFTSPSHTYVDNNGTLAGYPVNVTVADDDLASVSNSTTINVANVAPGNIVITPSTASTPEQQNVTFNISFTDPGVLDTESVLVDWGDGTTKTSLNLGTNHAVVLSHQWSEADTAAHPDGKYPVAVTITDKDGGVGTKTYTEQVTNVAPHDLRISENQSTIPTDPTKYVAPAVTINELGTVTVAGTFGDASGADTHTVTVDWGNGWGPADRVTTIPLAQGILSFSASRQYGDVGTYTITVTVSDDDGASTTATGTVTVNNITPTATINRGTTTTVQGTPTFLGHANHALPFSLHSYTPGSDDITVQWNWADGNTTSTTYLNAPPNADPALSPQVNPRDITDNQSHSWLRACVYKVGVSATDDEAASSSDSNFVVIQDNAAALTSAGQWKQNVQGKGTLPIAKLPCYLQIVRYMSSVFGSVTQLNNAGDAFTILQPSSSDPHMLLNRELLVAWLDYASGAIDWNTLVDTNGDGIPDTPFNAVMATAERVRLNPLSTQQQLLAQRNLLATILGD